MGQTWWSHLEKWITHKKQRGNAWIKRVLICRNTSLSKNRSQLEKTVTLEKMGSTWKNRSSIEIGGSHLIFEKFEKKWSHWEKRVASPLQKRLDLQNGSHLIFTLGKMGHTGKKELCRIRRMKTRQFNTTCV